MSPRRNGSWIFATYNMPVVIIIFIIAITHTQGEDINSTNINAEELKKNYLVLFHGKLWQLDAQILWCNIIIIIFIVA